MLVLLLAVLRPRLGTAGWCRYTAMTTQQVSNLLHLGRRDVSSFCGPMGVRASDIGPQDLVALAGITHVKWGCR